MPSCAQALLAWYDQNKRSMPWRDIQNPYATWVSETMLQQTQVNTVRSYYARFMEAFPTLADLAAAPEEQVLKLWEGLGYYSRARNLLKGAQQVMALHGGELPREEKALRAISGIGPYTAGAILSIAYNLPYPAVDGNVVRVMSRLHGVREDVGIPSVNREIYRLAQETMSRERPGDFNQAVMDLGATVCTPGTPNCEACPLRAFCDAYEAGDVDELPIKMKAKVPRIIPMGVGIVTCGDKVLVLQRQERMLGGLYTFVTQPEGNTKTALTKRLKALKVKAVYQGDLGGARHVFSHQIWEMRVHHYIAETMPAVPRGQWVTLEEMNALPFPTAMKKAKEYCHAILTEIH
ncbi:MAG: A/G-specific adenine glycosylase [Clostridia bacterium]|nr:A/G-specific adenine glycosylase [Clostridia bacterium]